MPTPNQTADKAAPPRGGLNSMNMKTATKIDPAAMYYTELPMMEAVLARNERNLD